MNSIKSLRMVISYAIIVCVLSIVIGALIGVPSSVAYFWTTVLALVALVSSLIQFIPQIMRTWKLKVIKWTLSYYLLLRWWELLAYQPC